jgi:DNA-directed RNA polymerase subunit M/transcription elongation factor TFIIS
MKFCPACRNMLYGIDEEVVDGEKTAVLTCRKCEYKEPITRENPLVYEHVLREDKTTKLVMNPYLKNDPTLDHLSNIVCPNTECPTKTSGAQPDVVPVKINEKQLVWMYQCVNCDFIWKQSSGAN